MNRFTSATLLLILLLSLGLGVFLYARQRSYQELTTPTAPSDGPRVEEPSVQNEPAYDLLAYTTTSAASEIVTVSLADQKKRIVFTDKDETLKVKGLRTATADGREVLTLMAKKDEARGSVLALVPTDGSGKIRTLLENFGSSEIPIPSPDGKAIAYIVFSNAESDYGYSLFVMNNDGSNKRRILRSETMLQYPAFNSEGTKIAYITESANGTTIHMIEVDGKTEARTLADFPNETVYDLFWGEDLVFGKRPKDDSSANKGEIYKLAQNGSSRTKLTNNDQYDGTPFVTRDGKTLALVRTTFNNGQYSASGNLTLVVINLADGKETELGAADGVLGWKTR